MKLKLYIHSFLGVTILLDLLYIYGVAGSLETDFITERQAMLRGVIACVFLAIAVYLYNGLERGKEMQLSNRKLEKLKKNDGRGMWQKLKEDHPILNEVIQWGITIVAILALIKSFLG